MIRGINVVVHVPSTAPTELIDYLDGQVKILLAESQGRYTAELFVDADLPRVRMHRRRSLHRRMLVGGRRARGQLPLLELREQRKTIVSGASVDVDRVALSHELGQLSELYVVQAGWWRHPEQKDECMRIARELAELSRAVLGTVDYVHAYERARAAEILLGHLEGARRLFHTILTPPQSGDPNDRPVQRP